MNYKKYYHQAKWTLCFVLIVISVSNSFSQNKCGVGTKWIESESGWTGVWTKTGECMGGSVFNAVWTHPTNPSVAWHNIQVYLQPNGRDLYIYRPSCWYEGTIQSDGVTVKGEYGCSWNTGPLKWEATILCDDLPPSSASAVIYPKSGKWRGWGEMNLSGNSEEWNGTYNDTYNKSKLGFVKLVFDGKKWSGTWGEPAIGREGQLYEIEILDGGKKIKGLYNVIKTGGKTSEKDVKFIWTYR